MIHRNSDVGLSEFKRRFVERNNLIRSPEMVKAFSCDVERRGVTKREKGPFRLRPNKNVLNNPGDFTGCR